MEGIFEALRWEWDGRLEHECHGNPEKQRRYNIGRLRAPLLAQHMEAFAVATVGDEQHAAFLFEVEPEDLRPDMPHDVRYEYVCGCRTREGRYIIFAYIWFKNLDDAKAYVRRHGMRILGGW